MNGFGKNNGYEQVFFPLNDIRDTFTAKFIRNHTNIEKTHYDILTEKYMKTFRNMNVIYMYGKTGTRKSIICS
jgi:hypothetical protein